MQLRQIAPSRDTGALMRPGFGLFGLQREIDRLFNEFAQLTPPSGVANLVPSIEIAETDNAIEISAEMPGLERNDVDISIEDDTLTIRGEKRVEDDQGDRNVQHTERTYGVFMRVLELPPGIDPNSLQATMSNGVLRITIPKPSKPEPKKIQVQDAQSKVTMQQGASGSQGASGAQSASGSQTATQDNKQTASQESKDKQPA
jgi:HSP20 family protein